MIKQVWQEDECPVVVRDFAAPFDPQVFRARFNGSVLASSETLDWPGLLVVKAHFEPGESVAPPVADYGLCLSLSGARGRLQRRLNGERLEQSSGCQSGQIHVTPARREAWWRGDSRCEILLIILREALFSRVAREVFDRDSSRAELLPQFGIRDPTLEHMARLLLTEIQTPELGGNLFVESLANALAVHLLRNYASGIKTETDLSYGLPTLQVRRVIDYIEAHLDDAISLAQMAQIAGYSAYHFSRMFKQATERSPHQYVLEKRIQRAKQLLRSSRLSAAEVAFEVGFSSQSHLVSAFKKVVGVTPKVYRAA